MGPAGPIGERGAPGMLAAVEVWTDCVHYDGQIRTHEGATYQAVRDTAKAPPHKDWRCIAAAGQKGSDGRSLKVIGTYDPKADYRELNVVALNGASFVARRDKPGSCPGDDWQLIASQGKRGEPGPRGAKGDPGPAVTALSISGEAMLVITNADGSSVRSTFIRFSNRCSALRLDDV
jgi:ribosomal protein S16